MIDNTNKQHEPQCEIVPVPAWYLNALIDTLAELVSENKTLKQHLNPTHEE